MIGYGAELSIREPFNCLHCPRTISEWVNISGLSRIRCPGCGAEYGVTVAEKLGRVGAQVQIVHHPEGL